MVISGSRSFEALGGTDTDAPRPRHTILLSAAIVAGLVVLAPVLAWLIGVFWTPPADFVPLLIGVGVAGGLYGVLVMIHGNVIRGAMVAVVVTATFAAEIPLTGAATAYQGSIGPKLFLVHLPLLFLVAANAWRGEYSLNSVARVEVVLAAFVGWSVLSATIGAPSRGDIALYYSLYMATLLIAFGVAYRCVRSNVATLRDVLAAFTIAVVGHAVFAVAQLINQGRFGMTFLGETARYSENTVLSLGPLEDVIVGLYVSGLTGGNGPLSVLLVVALPLALAFAVFYRGRVRAIGLLSVVLMAVILRTTAKDAARGGILVGVATFVLLYAWFRRHELFDRLSASLGVVFGQVTILSTVLFLPVRVKNEAGSGSTDGDVTSSAGNGVTTMDGSGSTGGDSASLAGDGVATTVDFFSATVPFFSLNTLGIRLQQYLVALAMFWDHPLLGVGGGNFPVVASTYGLPSPHGHELSLHNLYLSLLAETGLPGALLYLTAVGLCLWNGWQLITERGSQSVLLIGLLAAIVGYLATLFWVVNLRLTYELPLWILFGAMVGEHQRRQRRDP